MSYVIIIMGVAGSGKTTVGQALARRLQIPFYDGDDFHPPPNVDKMRRGQPLTDDDRWPWLDHLHTLIADHLARGEPAVLACSALKRTYRQRLRGACTDVYLVYLRGDLALMQRRLAVRQGHYMPAALLPSQFATLEEPTAAEAVIVDADQDYAQLMTHLVAVLRRWVLS